MFIIATFTNASVPETGLTPNIAIYRFGDNSQIVATTTMTAVTNGSYKYNFDAIAPSEDYHVWIDGGAGLAAADRYKTAIVQSDIHRKVTVT